MVGDSGRRRNLSGIGFKFGFQTDADLYITFKCEMREKSKLYTDCGERQRRRRYDGFFFFGRLFELCVMDLYLTLGYGVYTDAVWVGRAFNTPI